MDLLQLKLAYEDRLKRINEELVDFIVEKSISSEYGDIEGLDEERLVNCDLEWNNAMDERYYNVLEDSAWITNEFVELIDKLSTSQSDDKGIHKNKKAAISSIIHEVKRKIGESEDVIRHEYAFQNNCEEVLELLNQLPKISRESLMLCTLVK